MHNRNLRKKPNEHLIKLMEESIDLQLYLVQEKGPLCLTFQDNNKKKFQISIGNNITCSCGGGKIEHCVHTLFTLNKFFKIPFNHPLILQLTFSDSELNKLIEKKNSKPSDQINKTKSKELKIKIAHEHHEETNQMSLIEDSICSICQEDMYSSEGLYYCSNSCGHNYHINCLKIFIQHKKDVGGVSTCPMCRAKWNEEEFDKAISSSQIVKCFKRHQGVNCSGCQRTNIKFERFHCLHCQNYDLCSECFGSGIHMEKAHKFIMRKAPDDKWYGCDYNEGSTQRFVLRNIYLNQFLSDCLPDDKDSLKENNKSQEEEEVAVVDNTENNNENTTHSNSHTNKAHNKEEKKCSVCKVSNRGNSSIQFLMFKVFPCGHLIHNKCCEKVFKILSFENKNLIVDRNFNKCRANNPQTEVIFPGLESINYKVETPEMNHIQISNVTNQYQQEYNIGNLINIQSVKRTQKPLPNMKKQMIQKIMYSGDNQFQCYGQNNNSLCSAFSIQKVNFSNENNILAYENNYQRTKSVKPQLNIKKKSMTSLAPLKPIQNKIKKSETIIAKNKPNNVPLNNDLPLMNSDLLSIQPIRMNERPVRCENDNRTSLSPLLIDIPLEDNII